MVFQLKLLGADRELEVRGRWSCRDENGLYSGVLDAEGEVNQLQHLLLLPWEGWVAFKASVGHLILLAFEIW